MDVILIPLERTVISLWVARKPLVPHFRESAVKHCWEAGAQGLTGFRTSLLGPVAAALTSVSQQEALDGTPSCSEPSKVPPVPSKVV